MHELGTRWQKVFKTLFTYNLSNLLTAFTGGQDKNDPTPDQFIPFKPFSKHFLKFLAFIYQNKSKVSCSVQDWSTKIARKTENSLKGVTWYSFLSYHPV